MRVAGGEKHQQRRKRINQHIILRSHFLMAIKLIPAIWRQWHTGTEKSLG